MSKTKFGELIGFFKKKELEEIIIMGEQKTNGLFSNSILVLKNICVKYEEVNHQLFDLDWIFVNCTNIQNDNQWRNIQGNITEAFFSYISHKKTNNTLNQDFELLEFFKENGLTTNYKRLVAGIRKKLDNQYIDFHYAYYYDFRLKEHEIALNENNKKRKEINSLDVLDTKLEQFYYVNRLKLIIAKNNRKNLNSKIQLKSQQDFIGKIPPRHLSNPTISLLIDTYYMLTKREKKYYYQLKKRILTEKKVSFDFKSYILPLLQNFATRQYNAGNKEEFGQEYLSVISHMEKFNMLSKSGEINPQKIKNIATIVSRIPDIKWLKFFLRKCRNNTKNLDMMLPALNYSECLILFHEEKYNRAIDLLNNIKTTDESLKVSREILIIKCYFMLDKKEELSKKTDILRRKMNASKVFSPNQKTGRKNFIKYISIVFKNRNYTYELANTQRKIQQCKYFAEKDWILGQIDQIIGDKKLLEQYLIHD